MNFLLGTHQVDWLARAGVPLFVSRRRLADRRTLPRAVAPWALDSGGFTELNLHGRWTLNPLRYVAEVRRFRDEIGQLAWAAPMDWMCEPDVLAKTGLDEDEHQRRTVENFCTLRALAPDLPIIPVLQGWCVGSHTRCVGMYKRAGIDLRREPIVGVGTVCRRQGTLSISAEIVSLARMGLRLHVFGFKTRGLLSGAGTPFAMVDHVASADSLAWSFDGRRAPPLPGHTHKNCANCLEYALRWRAQLLDALPAPMPPEARAA
jgi:hypothetical protein